MQYLNHILLTITILLILIIYFVCKQHQLKIDSKILNLMKLKYLTIIILMSFTLPLLSQDFGSVGTQWYYSEHAAGSAPSNSEYLHYKVLKIQL